ncbi:probable ribonuclease P/MRP protein subunit POP5 [Phaseolus vulgaris]
MVGFRNRYMVMEVFVNPNRDKVGNDSIIITQFNVSKAVKDSLLENFGECGLASSLGSFQGSIRACKNAALKCEESKFEHYKLIVGDRFSTADSDGMNSCLNKIKVLEH